MKDELKLQASMLIEKAQDDIDKADKDLADDNYQACDDFLYIAMQTLTRVHEHLITLRKNPT